MGGMASLHNTFISGVGVWDANYAPSPPPGQRVRQCVRRQAQWKGREQVGQWEPLLCWQSCTLHFLFWERVWHLNLQGVPQFWCLGVSTLLGGCEVCVSVHGMVKN